MSTEPTVAEQKPEDVVDGEESDEYEVEVREQFSDQVLATHVYFPHLNSPLQLLHTFFIYMVIGRRRWFVRRRG